MSCEKLKTMQDELSIILNNPDATSQNYEDYYNKWGINYTNNSSVTNIAQCSAINAAIGSNKLEIPQSCTDATKKLCLSVDSKGKGSSKYDECWKTFRPTMSNINQSNKNMITSNCMVSSLIADPVLKRNKELSLLLNMNLAKQQIDCDDSKNNTFKNSVSSDTKITSLSDCINYNVANQQNIISACNVSDAVQKNISDIVSDCAIKSGDAPSKNYSDPNFASSNNNSDTIVNQNNTENGSNNYYLIIGCVSCCCCISIIIIIFIIIFTKK
jgi:hypothetical protein